MYSSLIQNFNRFVLEQLHQECSLDRASAAAGLNTPLGLATSPIQRVFGIKTANTNICGHCGLEEERITYPFVLDLMWPKPVSFKLVGHLQRIITQVTHTTIRELIH